MPATARNENWKERLNKLNGLAMRRHNAEKPREFSMEGFRSASLPIIKYENISPALSAEGFPPVRKT